MGNILCPPRPIRQVERSDPPRSGLVSRLGSDLRHSCGNSGMGMEQSGLDSDLYRSGSISGLVFARIAAAIFIRP